MENKFQFALGGRVAQSDCCEGRIEPTNYLRTKRILKNVGLDTGTCVRCRCMSRQKHAGLLDQQIAL